MALLTMALSLYLVVVYQHPEDKDQAWVPKIVVITGLCVAIWTVLLFPLDVANQQSCSLDIPLVDCSSTFPMQELWEGLYIANMVLVFALIPFSVFFYEADSEWYVAIALLPAVETTMSKGNRHQERSCSHLWNEALSMYHLGLRAVMWIRYPGCRNKTKDMNFELMVLMMVSKRLLQLNIFAIFLRMQGQWEALAECAVMDSRSDGSCRLCYSNTLDIWGIRCVQHSGSDLWTAASQVPAERYFRSQ